MPRWNLRALSIIVAFYGLAASTAIARDNLGGPVLAYAAEVDHLNQIHQPVSIDGLCASSCTMYLGVTGMCITHDAFFKFHAASLPHSEHPDASGSLIMLSHYPKAIRDWAMRVGALSSTAFTPAHNLSADEVHQMGIPFCN